MAKVYLSSTYSDLVEEREIVYKTLRKLRHDVISMEDYGATDERPLDKCLADVAACDIYVGVFAWRHGYKPPGHSQSITELEFREAQRTDRPCLLFLLSDEAPWPRNRMDEELDPIETLRAEIGRDYVVDFWETGDELATMVSVAVSKAWQPATPVAADVGTHLPFYRECLGRMTAELGNQIRFYSLSSAALLVLGLVILVAGAFVIGNQVLGLGGTLLGATTVFPLSTMFTTRRKKVVLDGYEQALKQDNPAHEIVEAVRRFLDSQLQP